MASDLEKDACDSVPIDSKGFNPKAKLPCGLNIKHIEASMKEFNDFLCFVNTQLHTKKLERIETMLMPANFSSMVGEFITSNLPKYCDAIVKNAFHNGHPDLIPKGKFKNDAVQHCGDGIEIKASRYLKGWQGHNPEDTWLMVFIFDCSRPTDKIKKIPPRPFKFLAVYGAQLSKNDWIFSGRSATSRRTITASVIASGYKKMTDNWIYKSP